MRVLIILLVFASSLSAQDGFLETFGHIQSARGSDLIVDDDSNIVVVGWGAGDVIDVQMIKTDLQGNTIWEKQYGTIHIDRAFSVMQGSVSNDDNYYVFGVLGRPDTLFEGNSEGLVLKIDKDGNEIWRVSWQDQVLNLAGEGFQDSNGDLLVAGYSKPMVMSSTTSTVITKISQSGSILWRKSYGDFLKPSDLLRHPSSDKFYVAGLYDYFSLSYPFVAAFDENGDTLWTKVYTDDIGYAYSAVLLDAPKNRLYLLSSYSAPGKDSIIPSISLLDSTGAMLWKKDFPPTNHRGFLIYDACQGEEGSILMFGDGVISQSQRSVWIGKYDPGEDTLCSKLLGGELETYAAAGVCLNHDVVLVTGALDNGMFLLKDRVCAAPAPPGSPNQIFPNPISSVLNIDLEVYSSDEVELKVYNPLGQLVIDIESVPVVDNRLVHTLDFGLVRPGVYFLVVVENDDSQVFRLVKY